MSSFRFAVFATSMALVLSFGSSAIATTNSAPPVPDNSIDAPALDLRAVGSQLVVETIEDAMRHGGLALFGEGFQFESSLDWVYGKENEGMEGGLDAAIPLLSGSDSAIFLQPGAVFWTGLGEGQRVDGNFGLVYRTNLENTFLGIDAVGGASLFHDWDFRSVGHSRFGVGADLQVGIFRGAFNYYHPLSDEKDGQREGFAEELLRGMDLQFVFERNVIRAGARLGYWKHEGEGGIGDEWELSFGLDGGVQLFPGVFIEGEWEKHQEDFLLDERLGVGLAVRFSLPDFKGVGYGDGSTSSNLYKLVGREKRLLYKERDDGTRTPDILPTVSLRGGGSVSEGSTVVMTVALNQPLGESVVINLLGSGTAEYGAGKDWQLHNGVSDCETVTGADCQVTIPAGETGVDVVVTALSDGSSEGEETITLTIAISDALSTGLRLGTASRNIAISSQVAVISLEHSGNETTIEAGVDAGINAVLALSEELNEDVTINLVPIGSAVHGISEDWYIRTRAPSGSAVAPYELCGSLCAVTFAAGQTAADVQISTTGASGSIGRTIGVRVQIPVALRNKNLVTIGSANALEFTITSP